METLMIIFGIALTIKLIGHGAGKNANRHEKLVERSIPGMVGLTQQEVDKLAEELYDARLDAKNIDKNFISFGDQRTYMAQAKADVINNVQTISITGAEKFDEFNSAYDTILKDLAGLSTYAKLATEEEYLARIEDITGEIAILKIELDDTRSDLINESSTRAARDRNRHVLKRIKASITIREREIEDSIKSIKRIPYSNFIGQARKTYGNSLERIVNSQLNGTPINRHEVVEFKMYIAKAFMADWKI